MQLFSQIRPQLYARQDYDYIDGLTLCFDLDGTLIDTAPDLIRVLNLVIAEEGLPETDYKTSRKLIGYGSRRMIVDAFAKADHEVSAARIDELRELFLTLYADDIAQLSQPFAGVIDTLKQWHIWAAAGHRDYRRIVMVGDAYPDIRAAHNARVPSILMSYGYTPKPIMRLKADVILNDFRQIPSALNKLSCLSPLG